MTSGYVSVTFGDPEYVWGTLVAYGRYVTGNVGILYIAVRYKSTIGQSCIWAVTFTAVLLLFIEGIGLTLQGSPHYQKLQTQRRP